MAKRPTFHPDLGRFFAGLREERGWSQRQAAAIAKRRDVSLNYNAIWRLETGKIKNPEPEVMRAIAQLYELEYADVVQRFIGVRFGLTSPVRSTDQGSVLSTGGAPGVPASDAVSRLESIRERDQTLSGEVRDAIRRLTRIATTLEEEAAADSTAAASGARRDRKTRRRRSG
jgi:transcriptional regulator with XRE-family HTH domain